MLSNCGAGRRLLRVPCTTRRSNQSILKEINPEYSLEGLIPKLKLQYFGYLMWKANSLEKSQLTGKDPDAGKDRARGEEGDRGWDGWMVSPMQWTWTWANSRRWWGTGRPDKLQSTGSQRIGHDWATEQQQQLPMKESCHCQTRHRRELGLDCPEGHPLITSV